MKNFITKNENGTNVINNDKVYDTVRAVMFSFNLYSVNFANEEEATDDTENNRLFISVKELKKDLTKRYDDYEEYLEDEVENHMENLHILLDILDYALNNEIEDIMVINKDTNWFI